MIAQRMQSFSSERPHSQTTIRAASTGQYVPEYFRGGRRISEATFHLEQENMWGRWFRGETVPVSTVSSGQSSGGSQLLSRVRTLRAQGAPGAMDSNVTANFTDCSLSPPSSAA